MSVEPKKRRLAPVDGTGHNAGVSLPFPVPMTVHTEIRQKLGTALRAVQDLLPNSVVVLQGGSARMMYDTDREFNFRQESYFHYLFGVTEPDVYGMIDVDSGKSILCFPKLPESYAVWMGELSTTDSLCRKYAVDHVIFVDEMESYLVSLDAKRVLVMSGTNSDSGASVCPASFPGMNTFSVDSDILFPVLMECRVIKTKMEQQVMRYAAAVSSRAHCEVMRAVKPGMKEYEAEALFQYSCHSGGGCRFTAYTCICASGCHGATLHYPYNDKEMYGGDLVVFDMGGEYHCYASDITCSFPVNGVYTDDQRGVYETVLAAVQAVESKMKPGIEWENMHLLAEETILIGLRRLGILHGSVEDMMACYLAAVFMPHGLGHFLGKDVHDVGGYPHGVERINRPGIRSLRARRPLKTGMVITVEPGVYFIEPLIEKALADPVQSKLINVNVLNRFRGTGGVRIEDDVIVTESGIDNLTQVPRAVEDIERVCAGGDWKVVVPCVF